MQVRPWNQCRAEGVAKGQVVPSPKNDLPPGNDFSGAKVVIWVVRLPRRGKSKFCMRKYHGQAVLTRIPVTPVALNAIRRKYVTGKVNHVVIAFL